MYQLLITPCTLLIIYLLLLHGFSAFIAIAPQVFWHSSSFHFTTSVDPSAIYGKFALVVKATEGGRTPSRLVRSSTPPSLSTTPKHRKALFNLRNARIDAWIGGWLRRAFLPWPTNTEIERRGVRGVRLPSSLRRFSIRDDGTSIQHHSTALVLFSCFYYSLSLPAPLLLADPLPLASVVTNSLTSSPILLSALCT
ncbi:hypothetical protein BJ912DRAFT_147719 [Pholiota molesta]|nr:hypothetical protein BJ912DRAFT_147719 [Pholiota molesta]